MDKRLVRSNGRCEGGERRIREGEGRGKRLFIFGRDFIQEWRKGDFYYNFHKLKCRRTLVI
jgi:hypothetical protein